MGADGRPHAVHIVVEAEPVGDDAELVSLAAAWRGTYDVDWRWEARDGRFFDADGSPDGRGAQVFRVTPSNVLISGTITAKRDTGSPRRRNNRRATRADAGGRYRFTLTANRSVEELGDVRVEYRTPMNWPGSRRVYPPSPHPF